MLNNKNQFNIVVCASGGGGNFQVLVNHAKENNYKIKLLIVDRLCGAVTRAIENKIKYTIIANRTDEDDFFMAIDNKISIDTDLIILAGFMPIITATLCQKWKNKIINTHPSLLPKYGGKGMYGVKVQEAVMANKEKYAGCTIHYVNEGIDEGEIILQKKLKVDYSETPWDLGGRIFKEEGILLVRAINMIKGKISV